MVIICCSCVFIKFILLFNIIIFMFVVLIYCILITSHELYFVGGERFWGNTYRPNCKRKGIRKLYRVGKA